MIYTKNAFCDFLSQTAPFNKLPPEEMAQLAETMQPLRYRMGQVVMVREKMPPHIAIVYEGQARLLGYDPRTNMPVTLKLLRPGSIIGCVNLVRGTPCETVIASSEATCLTLSIQEFVKILERHPFIKTEFQNQCSLIEVFDLLGNQLVQEAIGDGNLKNLALEALERVEVKYLPSGEINLAEDKELQKKENIWVVSGGEITSISLGSRINIEKTPTIEVNSNRCRLIGIPSEILQQRITEEENQIKLEKQITKLEEKETVLAKNQTKEENQTEKPNHYTVLDNGNSGNNGNNGTKRNLIPIDPTPEEIEEEEIPYAPVELVGEPQKEQETETQGRGKRKDKNKKYPHIYGKDPIDAGVAIFQMLSKYFGMPFRKEVINRVVTDQINRGGNLSLNVCGAIMELMGLSAQLITIPGKSLSRANTPILLQWQDSLAIIYEINDKEVVIGVPEMGILTRPIEDFLETWESPGQILLLKKNKETPQERFGLNWFIPSLKKYSWTLIQVFIASFFVQLFGLANPLMIQIIIDKVINNNSPDTLNVLGTLLFVIAIAEALLTTLRTYLFVDTTNRIDMALGSEIIDHLLRLPLRYFERRPVGEISTRVNELEKIRQFLTGTALTVVLDAVFSVVYIAVMFFYSPLLTLVALGIIPIFVVMTLIFSPTIRRQLRNKAEKNAQTQSYLVEVMSGIQTVKAQNIELRSRWQWQEKYARYVGAGFNTVITSTLAGSTSSFLNKLSALLVLWVGASLVLQGELTLGQLIAFRIISSYVTSPILRLTQLWQNFQETALSLERLADIVDHPQEAEEDRQNIPMPLIKGKIRYENVSFRFKNSGPLQLNNVSVEIPVGTFVGIVGQSGAGKSTLTKLVSRLYEPEGGRILVDGYDINKVELYSLRRQIGVVPQETLLFDGTVQDNIGLTNPDATTEEIIQAAKVAAAHEFIMGLPNGYNTRVGERGAGLSGGQRQRIAIARSVLQRPQILVLDEATSALDYNTEQQVCHNLIDAFSDRTVLFITHRLGTIKKADLIIMMEQGKIVEQGTHEELMALRGLYYCLYQQQEATK